MKKIILFILCAAPVCGAIVSAQTISRKVIATAGGTLTSAAGEINYSIGETMIASLSAGGNMITQGFEQPAESGLNLKLYLQGYYSGSGTMQPVLMNQGLPAPITETDTILVELHDAENFKLVDSKKAVLLTDGTVSVNFTQPEGTYYIAIKHRNTIQTWSTNPVVCTANSALYNFSSAANMAMGDNQAMVEPNIYALYTGDINQDDYIDGNDFPLFDFESASGGLYDGTYSASDMNGDGFVDGNDFPVYDGNSSLGVSAIYLYPVLNIGDDFGGGKVAYILQPGNPGFIDGQVHGLIAAPTDQSAGTHWGCPGFNVAGGFIDYGWGQFCTTNVVNQCGASDPTIAARICDDFVLNGYSDWFLPSRDELLKFYENKNAIGGFLNSLYWTSNNFEPSRAWVVNFNDTNGTGGFSAGANKNASVPVRAARYF